MLQTRRFTGIKGLELLRDSWISLHDSASLFARYEWHYAIAKHLVPDESISYIEVYESGRTVAVVSAIKSIVELGPFRQLRVRSGGLGAPSIDFPIAADVDIEDVAAALQCELGRGDDRWDALYWPRVLESSNALRLARTFSVPRRRIALWDVCNTLIAEKPFDRILAGVSKNLRASLRKSQKRLDNAGGASFTRNGMPFEESGTGGQLALEPASREIELAYESFLSIEASGWKGERGCGSAIALSAAKRGFYSELLSQSGPGFRSEVVLLEASGGPIAGQFSVTVDDCRYVLKTGYNEEKSRFSPGQVLMAKVLETACEQGTKRINLITNMPWHQTWRPSPIPAFSVLVFRSHLFSARYYCNLVRRRISRVTPQSAAARPS